VTDGRTDKRTVTAVQIDLKWIWTTNGWCRSCQSNQFYKLV